MGGEPLRRSRLLVLLFCPCQAGPGEGLLGPSRDELCRLWMRWPRQVVATSGGYHGAGYSAETLWRQLWGSQRHSEFGGFLVISPKESVQHVTCQAPANIRYYSHFSKHHLQMKRRDQETLRGTRQSLSGFQLEVSATLLVSSIL